MYFSHKIIFSHILSVRKIIWLSLLKRSSFHDIMRVRRGWYRWF